MNGPGIENLDEVWFTEPDLPGGATSATTAELPTGQPLLAALQANFLRNDLASTSSGDGEVNLSFFSNSIATSEFEISAPVTNEAPILDAIGDRSVDEGGLLSYPAGHSLSNLGSEAQAGIIINTLQPLLAAGNPNAEVVIDHLPVRDWRTDLFSDVDGR